jgi:hypothetical protein
MLVPRPSRCTACTASLGLTFSYDVTVGIPLYMLIAQMMMRCFPLN